MKFSLESRLESKSFEPLINFLPFMVPHKPLFAITLQLHSASQAIDLFKSSKDVVSF